MFWKEVVGLIALIVIAICIVYQHRALNKIAFGRSMFIVERHSDGFSRRPVAHH